MKKSNWVLILSFGLLLMLLLMIGAVGVRQITVLSNRIYDLTKRQVPLQKNVLNMKNSAQLYSGAVRNYVAWRIGKYVGAAQYVANEEEINKISQKLLTVIDRYSGLTGSEGNEHNKQLLTLFGRMQDTEQRIVQLVDVSIRAGHEKENSSKISSLLVSFESQTYQFSQFVEKNIEPLILDSLQSQLEQTKNERAQRILMMLSAVFAVFILGLISAIFVLKKLIKEQKHSELLVNHMVCAEEREKRNLSFQMHNQMGQDLSALKIYLGIINNKCGEIEELENGRKIVERLLERMHNIAELLCPPGLEDFGLEPMLNNMVNHFRSIMDGEIITDLKFNSTVLSPENALTLYRVVQESLTNIVKHAQAKNVKIKLQDDGNFIELFVEDDGKGFVLKKADTELERAKTHEPHLGLLLLQERLSILNARMQIHTSLGQGTRIVVKMPLL